MAVETSTSCQLFEFALTTYYVPLEVWYMRTILDKVGDDCFESHVAWLIYRGADLPIVQAHAMSKPDLTQFPATTTTPDDAFYILKIVLSRLLSTSNTPIVQQASEVLRDVMDRDYAGVIKKKLDDVYRTGGAGSAARSEKESRQSFIVSTTSSE